MTNLSELEPMPVADTATSPEHNAEDNQAGTPLALIERSAPIASPARNGTAPVLLFDIPPGDREFFNTRLGHEVQREVKRMLSYARTIHQAANKEGTCKRLAAQLARTEGTADASGQLQPPRGWAWKSILRKFYDFTNEQGCVRTEAGREVHYERGDWRMFWDKAKWPVAKTGRVSTSRDCALSPAFLNFVRANYERNQRGKFATFHGELIELVRTGYALNDLEVGSKVIPAGHKVPSIPGYGEWPTINQDTGMPDGWSLANLQRKIKPDDFERAAATIGRAAASTHRLKVHTTRVGLLCGEFFEFDDHEFNVKVVYPGQRKFLRPRGFFAIDVLSASCFARGLKPTLWDLELQKKEALTEADFMWFVVSILTSHGFRTDERGTTLVVERGTAAIRDDFEARISDATGGRVKVSRGGKFQQRAHVGQLDAATKGHGKGNYRFKALIESFFNLVDNAFASLAGQTGLNRDRCPEQLAMLEAECRDLMVAMTQVEGIQLGLPTWEQFFWQAQRLLDFIDDRKRHDIEGWRKLGFVTQPLLTTTGEVAVPARTMSPKEVFAAGSKQLAPLARHELPALLGPEHCYRAGGKDTVEVRNGVVAISNEEWTGTNDEVRFLAVDYRGDRLKNGERFRAYLNPFDTSVLVLCDAHNRALAECPRIDAPSRNSLEGVKREMGRATKWQADALAGMNERHIAGANEIAQRRERNANAITGRNLRLEAKEERALTQRNARRAASEPDDISAFGEPETTKADEGGDSKLDALNEF